MKGPRGSLPALAVLAVVVTLAQGGCRENTSVEAGKSGQDLFQVHCSGCHPDGGNIVYPRKSLDRMTLMANGITKPNEIVALMRNPGQGMKQFDRTAISDRDARRIADYILAAFR
jgi:cytochrome c6